MGFICCANNRNIPLLRVESEQMNEPTNERMNAFDFDQTVNRKPHTQQHGRNVRSSTLTSHDPSIHASSSFDFDVDCVLVCALGLYGGHGGGDGMAAVAAAMPLVSTFLYSRLL